MDLEPKTSAERNDYPGRFSPHQYLDQYYKTPGSPENRLRDFGVDNLHKVFSRLFPQEQEASCQSNKVRVLDYGCGPAVANTISAAGIPNVSEIVLAEYTTRNREAVQQWLDKDPSAFNWSLYFKYIVQTLEGKTEHQVDEREERMRSLVKVVPCDISQDPPIEKGYEGPYDIVISFLCLVSCCNSVDEYHAGVVKLSSMVKPGGLLLIYSLDMQPGEEPNYYLVGSQYFYAGLNTSCDIVTSALEAAALNVLSVNRLEMNKDPSVDNCHKFVFICAEKKKS